HGPRGRTELGAARRARAQGEGRVALLPGHGVRHRSHASPARRRDGARLPRPGGTGRRVVHPVDPLRPRLDLRRVPGQRVQPVVGDAVGAGADGRARRRGRRPRAVLRHGAPGEGLVRGGPAARGLPARLYAGPVSMTDSPTTAERAATPRPVLVVDFGAQYAQLIARRVREAGVYSEIVPHTLPVERILAKDPAAIILSGGPASVYAEDAPGVDAELFAAGVPVLGICYGFQAMASALGGTVARTGDREYGATVVELCAAGTLLEGTPEHQQVWMSHGDAVQEAPEGFDVLATSPGAPVAAFEDRERRLFGMQWHPEVKHSAFGQAALERFLYEGAGLAPTWTAGNVIAEQVAAIREQVGDARVICGLSGGVDSSVAAALVQKAVGDQLTCVFVDHGLLRAGEAEQVEQDFVAATGVNLKVVDASKQFLDALAGVTDPEEKRKIIGREFIRTFEQAAREIVAEAGHDEEVRFLVQGTLYPDVVESGGGEGAANIKSHHNVGGLPDDLQFELVEPLRTLFKDEVRAVGLELGVPES